MGDKQVSFESKCQTVGNREEGDISCQPEAGVI